MDSKRIMLLMFLGVCALACISACSKQDQPNTQAKAGSDKAFSGSTPREVKPPDDTALVGKSDALTGTIHTPNLNGVITIDSPDGNAPTKTLLLAGDAKITLDGYPSSVKELRTGMSICYRPVPDDGPLPQFEAYTIIPDGKPHTNSGAVTTVEPDKLVFLAGTRGTYPCALAIKPDTSITLDGKPAPLSDLKRGMPVKVEYIGYDAKTVEAATQVNDGAIHRVRGNLKAIEADRFVIHSGKPGFDVTLQTGPDMKITLGGNPGAASDLFVGQAVSAIYSNGVITEISSKTSKNPGAQPADVP